MIGRVPRLQALRRENPPRAPIRSKDRFLVFGAPAIEDAEIEEVLATMKSGWLGTGPKAAQFEKLGEQSARRRPDIEANLNEPLPIPSEVAFTVVSLSVLEHLSEPQTMLDDAFRILRPGGSIVLEVPWQWQIHEAPHDYFRYTPFGLQHLFHKAGFLEVQIEPQGGFFTSADLKANYFSMRFIRARGSCVSHRGTLSVFWYIGQRLAPLIDKLDRDPALETSGYYVTGRKSPPGSGV